MKVSCGKTYVGRSGRRRYVMNVSGYDMGTKIVKYDVPDGDVRFCELATFERWAVREARDDEAAPGCRGKP